MPDPPPHPPAPDRLQRLLLPVADGFMALMLSRPPTGTLRTTRVTGASIGLATATCAATAALAGLLAAAAQRSGPVLMLPAALLMVLAVGSGSLALYGLRQRRS